MNFLHRKEISHSYLYHVMKPDHDSKKTDGDIAKSSLGDGEGIDALVVLQVVGGIIAAAALVWLILRDVLHII